VSTADWVATSHAVGLTPVFCNRRRKGHHSVHGEMGGKRGAAIASCFFAECEKQIPEENFLGPLEKEGDLDEGVGEGRGGGVHFYAY